MSYFQANSYRNPFQTFLLSPQISSCPLGIPLLPSPSGFCTCTVPFTQNMLYVVLSGVVHRGPGPVASCHLRISLHPWDSYLLFCYAEQFCLLSVDLQLHSGAQLRRRKTGLTDFRRSFSDHLWLFQDALWQAYTFRGPARHFPNQGDVLLMSNSDCGSQDTAVFSTSLYLFACLFHCQTLLFFKAGILLYSFLSSHIHESP